MQTSAILDSTVPSISALMQPITSAQNDENTSIQSTFLTEALEIEQGWIVLVNVYVWEPGLELL